MVEVLVVPGCPGAQLTLQRVQAASEQLGVRTNLRVLTVDRDEDATKLGFVGSPTVRVDVRLLTTGEPALIEFEI